eukprot:5316312-Prymnesium_polylepis.2
MAWLMVVLGEDRKAVPRADCRESQAQGELGHSAVPHTGTPGGERDAVVSVPWAWRIFSQETVAATAYASGQLNTY